MNKKFKIIAINGSHRAENGFSQVIMDKFLDGAKSAGADCTVFYPSKMKIEHCKACHKCILKTPGKCFINDEMSSVIKMIEEADLLLFVAPVYFDTMTSHMKKLMERFMPFLGPVFEYKNNRTFHKPLKKMNLNVVNILLSGNPERESLNSISGTLKRIVKNMEWNFINELFFTSSHLTVSNPELLEEQFKALTNGGKEIVLEKQISSETVDSINRNYIDDPEVVIDQMNQHFQDIK